MKFRHQEAIFFSLDSERGQETLVVQEACAVHKTSVPAPSCIRYASGVTTRWSGDLNTHQGTRETLKRIPQRTQGLGDINESRAHIHNEFEWQ